jgi:hypothetical protein
LKAAILLSTDSYVCRFVILNICPRILLKSSFSISFSLSLLSELILQIFNLFNYSLVIKGNPIVLILEAFSETKFFCEKLDFRILDFSQKNLVSEKASSISTMGLPLITKE